MTSRAFIAGCLGTSLNADERAFFRDARPWGFILFKRNTQSPEQVAALTAEMRETVGWHAPILIDQEGGRVQRMGPPNWPKYPSARAFLAINDPIRQREIVRLNARLMAHDLRSVGIDVDCLPVLDVPVTGSHDVIGDRAYAHDPDHVARLGRAAAEGLIAGGVLPVMKHMPGHGRARADSHHDLPIVDASLDELRAHDFRPFRHLADMPLAMTAHLVFTALDPKNPATISRRIVREIMRGELGFDGLIMTGRHLDEGAVRLVRGEVACRDPGRGRRRPALPRHHGRDDRRRRGRTGDDGRARPPRRRRARAHPARAGAGRSGGCAG